MRISLLAILLASATVFAQGAPHGKRSSTGGSAAGISIGSFGSTPNANGLSFNAGTLVLQMQPADATHPGAVTTGTQTIAGAKTLSGGITLGASGITFNDATTQTTAAAAPTIAAFGSSPTANGATISGSAITLQPADGTHPGAISTGAQTIAGAKTFSGTVTGSGFFTANTAGYGFGGSSGSTQGFWASGSNTLMTWAGAGNHAEIQSNGGVVGARFNSTGIDLTANTDAEVTMAATDSSGTPGAATVNKPSGQAAIAAAAGSVVITNSLAKTTSVITATLQATDTTCVAIKNVIPASGSFTINVNAACTGNTKVGWVLFN